MLGPTGRIRPRGFVLGAATLTVLLCLYYASRVSDEDVRRTDHARKAEPMAAMLNADRPSGVTVRRDTPTKKEVCPKLTPSEADVHTLEVFKDFDFQPSWVKNREFWDKTFEDRFERQKMDAERPPLKVIIVPHSHNDPGWLRTFENYFHYESRKIISEMVNKMQQYQNLTFIWSEVVFLHAWWEVAHPTKQKALRALAKSGRLEITTGGWVMTDEANAHVYAMVDQLIEGHQWIWTNLGVKPKTGWSIDPFGHGSTQPYILSQSGIEGTVIQRIHYAWKQWLALKQYDDFRWIPAWTPNDPSSHLLTHNQPFDIYSIKHSCGPHPYICLNFDFRKVQGEYTEYSIKAQFITEKNVKQKSELLLEQYARTGSLFPHNVVLMPLGDDFRFNHVEEWDQQYTNYMKLVDYINSNRDTYKTEISFGTPADYFTEIQRRYDQYPSLKGDFFVYSDIFSEGRPAYWSGYYTTRPFMKIMDRELEASLRGAEILYSLALPYAKEKRILPVLKLMERDFERLVRARRNLGLFQHHDAITGTSKAFVMRDYGLKLFESLRDTMEIQQNAIQALMIENQNKPGVSMILSDIERENFEKLPRKTPLNIGKGQTRQVILYNSLAQPQDYVVHLRITTINVNVVDSKGNPVLYEINPVWNGTENNNRILISTEEYELVFIAKLPELSLSTYNIVHQNEEATSKLSTTYCDKCHVSQGEHPEFLKTIFKLHRTQPGDVLLENQRFQLQFSGTTGFLKSITRKHTQKITHCQIQFAAYRSAQFHSGAYLFMPDPNDPDMEMDVLLNYNENVKIVITSGVVSSQVTVFYGPFLVHTVRIYNVANASISDGLYIENVVDFEKPPKNRETELFMRLVSEIQNGEPPEFYSDSNGFQMQKRIKVERIGIEGNYFPITTMAYIEDDALRLSLLTDHAQGAASWQPGFLEIMLDRRTLYDDSRGMGEGLVDNRKTVHKFWLLLEDVEQMKSEKYTKRFENENSGGDEVFQKGEVVRTFNARSEPPLETSKKDDRFPRPSLFANQLSNSFIYPVKTFFLDEEYMEISLRKFVPLITHPLPDDVHLMTLRTQQDATYSQFPSNQSILVLHRQGYDCTVNSKHDCKTCEIHSGTKFQPQAAKEMRSSSLTGVTVEGDKFTDLTNANVNPMELKALHVTF